MVHQDVISALGADQMQKVCDFSDKEKEAAQKEIDEDKRKRLELQADMGRGVLRRAASEGAPVAVGSQGRWTRAIDLVNAAAGFRKLASDLANRERLARAAKDLDYSAFEESDKQKWRNQCAILDSLRPLDALGNFAVAEAERAAAAAWAHACERQDANGGKRPPPPRNLPAPPKRARRVPLPEPLPVS